MTRFLCPACGFSPNPDCPLCGEPTRGVVAYHAGRVELRDELDAPVLDAPIGGDLTLAGPYSHPRELAGVVALAALVGATCAFLLAALLLGWHL